MNFFKKTIKNTPEHIRFFSIHSMDIAYLIDEFLLKKGWQKQEFAEKLGKNPSEISKWLSGNHNFTISTISKLEEIMNVEIVKVISDDIIRIPNRLEAKIIDINSNKPIKHKDVAFSGIYSQIQGI
ncbi:MAG: helix-turn-helix transcriptional regulator [Bacteroidota bacterium]